MSLAADRTSLYLTPTVRARLAAELHPQEEVLWAAQPIAIHAWTALAVSHLKSRLGRAISVVLLVGFSVFLLGIGLVFLAACIDSLLTPPWGVAKILLLVLFTLISLAACGGGVRGITAPLVVIRGARRRWYILTDRNAFIVMDHEDSIDLKRFDLTGIDKPQVYRCLDSGVGDVVFGYSAVTLNSGDGIDNNAFFDTGFAAVPDAHALAARLEEARRLRWENAETEVIAEMQQDYQGYLRRTGSL